MRYPRLSHASRWNLLFLFLRIFLFPSSFLCFLSLFLSSFFFSLFFFFSFFLYVLLDDIFRRRALTTGVFEAHSRGRREECNFCIKEARRKMRGNTKNSRHVKDFLFVLVYSSPRVVFIFSKADGNTRVAIWAAAARGCLK